MFKIKLLLSGVFIAGFLFQQLASAQSIQCRSNKNEIDTQVRGVNRSFEERISAVKSERKWENLSITASSMNTGAKNRARQEHNRKYDSIISDLELQRNLSIADLKSRIIETCEDISVPEVNKQNKDASLGGEKLVKILTQLASMHESGILSDEEFQAAKRRALGL